MTKHHVKECLYSILGVETTATQDEIKQAYRKQALVWHPDKNAHRLDEATERFKVLSNAYTTLSDPQEKSWYDQHRDQILRGHEPGEKDEEGLDLFPYFSTTAFSGFGDDEEGFFAVYSEVFSTVDKEEEAEEDQSTYHKDAPSFGKSDSNWKDVQAFYSFWEGFSTIRDFFHADAYNPMAAPNRQVRRLMEKANLKERGKARKQYNETVRNLVFWVKKRDPRVRKAMKEMEEEKKRKEEMRIQKEKEEAKKREELRKNHVFEYTPLDAKLEQEYAEMERKKGEDEEEEDELYCVACDKYFKSSRQMANHEKSKKHLENVQILKDELMMEDEMMNLNLQDNGGGAAAAVDDEDEEEEVVEDKKSSKKKKKDKKKNKKEVVEDEEEEEGEEEGEGVAAESSSKVKGGEEEEEDDDEEDSGVFDELRKAKEKRAKKKLEKKKKKQRSPFFDVAQKNSDDDDDEDEEEISNGKKQQTKGVAAAVKKEEEDGDEEEEQEEAAVSTPVSGKKGKRNDKKAKKGRGRNDDDDDDEEIEDMLSPTFLLRKKDKNNKKKNAAAAETEEKVEIKGEEKDDDDDDDDDQDDGKGGKKKKERRRRKDKTAEAGPAAPPSLKCRICGEQFTSNNQIHKHIKQTGHAIAEGFAPSAAAGGGKKRR